MARRIDSKQLEFKDKDNTSYTVTIDKIPDKCPICDNGIDAKYIDSFGKQKKYDEGYYVESIYRCPLNDCQGIFIGFYTSGPYFRSSFGDDYVYLRNTYVPAYFEEVSFEEEIKKISPHFVKIFTQSSIAEEIGLIDICGAGYRKALEFLIKDYLKLIKPDLKEELEGHMLGYVIANYVENDRILTTAGLAKEKGNDETHYIKKLEDLSIEDFKKLIILTSNWIVDDLLTEKYAGLHKKILTVKKN